MSPGIRGSRQLDRDSQRASAYPCHPAGDAPGNVPAFNFYNRTSCNAEITWSYNYLGTQRSGTICARPGGGDLYVPMFAAKVSWQTRTC